MGRLAPELDSADAADRPFLLGFGGVIAALLGLAISQVAVVGIGWVWGRLDGYMAAGDAPTSWRIATVALILMVSWALLWWIVSHETFESVSDDRVVFLLRRGIGDWTAVRRVVIVFAVFGTLWSVPWVRPDAPEFTGFFGEVGWGWV